MNREERRAQGRANGTPMAPAETGIQFSPVPVNTNVVTADMPGGRLVLLVVTTPTGPQGYFLSPEHARQLAGHLTQFALAASSGLEIIGDAGLAEP